MATKVVSSITTTNGLVQSGTTIDSTAAGQALIRDGAALVFRALVAADVAGAGGSYSDAQAKDAMAAAFAAGTHTGITFSYNTSTDTMSASVTAGGLAGTIDGGTF